MDEEESIYLNCDNETDSVSVYYLCHPITLLSPFSTCVIYPRFVILSTLVVLSNFYHLFNLVRKSSVWSLINRNNLLEPTYALSSSRLTSARKNIDRDVYAPGMTNTTSGIDWLQGATMGRKIILLPWIRLLPCSIGGGDQFKDVEHPFHKWCGASYIG